MVTIQSIVQEALNTRVLTSRQQRHINTLLLHMQYQESDFEALKQLYQAIDQGIVVSGSNSLAVIGA
ncbi:MAG: hypothetical protein NW237_14000 [Cyanobacteriota bacterium]|nr:hypothetical protein [Cyanobacteriota bacterium]